MSYQCTIAWKELIDTALMRDCSHVRTMGMTGQREFTIEFDDGTLLVISADGQMHLHSEIYDDPLPLAQWPSERTG